MYFGFHKTKTGWVFREWLPGADKVWLYGDFNLWNHTSHPLKNIGGGVWEIKLKGEDALKHEQYVKLIVEKGGKTFERIGGADVPKRSFDEHMVLELSDGVLAMYVRANYGIGVSYSYDRGRTWTKGIDSGLGGPCSRFFIRRFPTSQILTTSHISAICFLRFNVQPLSS